MVQTARRVPALALVHARVLEVVRVTPMVIAPVPVLVLLVLAPAVLVHTTRTTAEARLPMVLRTRIITIAQMTTWSDSPARHLSPSLSLCVCVLYVHMFAYHYGCVLYHFNILHNQPARCSFLLTATYRLWNACAEAAKITERMATKIAPITAPSRPIPRLVQLLLSRWSTAARVSSSNCLISFNRSPSSSSGSRQTRTSHPLR